MMTGLVRKATLLSVCGLVAASVAMAGVPSAGNSTIGTGITLVGTAGGVVDVKGQKLIVVRDALNNPVQNSTVTINFTACTTAGAELRLCSTQPQAGVGVSCGNHEVVALTDASGIATFRVVGNALNPGGGSPGLPAAGFGTAGAVVKADGVTLGTLNVGAYDQNGAGGVGSVDLALVANDRFSVNNVTANTGNFRGRSDFNGDGFVNSVDLALEAQVRFGPGSIASCASACP